MGPPVERSFSSVSNQGLPPGSCHASMLPCLGRHTHCRPSAPLGRGQLRGGLAGRPTFRSRLGTASRTERKDMAITESNPLTCSLSCPATLLFCPVRREQYCRFPASGAGGGGLLQTRAFALTDLVSPLFPAPAQQLLEVQDVAATGTAFVLAVLWVRMWDEIVARGFIDSKLSRKLVHITSGLLFMFSWPLFSNGVEARFFAAAVPAANVLRLSLLGLGVTKNEAVVKAVSREGNPRELLRGPLFYVITIALVTIMFWRTSPVGAIALVMMCGGDGIADIVGRRWGSGARLPWNRKKSWAGTISMFVFGSLLSFLFVYLFCLMGFYGCHWWSWESCATIAAIALGSTLVESLPISTILDDNFTVPCTAIVLGQLLMSHI